MCSRVLNFQWIFFGPGLWFSLQFLVRIQCIQLILTYFMCVCACVRVSNSIPCVQNKKYPHSVQISIQCSHEKLIGIGWLVIWVVRDKNKMYIFSCSYLFWRLFADHNHYIDQLMVRSASSIMIARNVHDWPLTLLGYVCCNKLLWKTITSHLVSQSASQHRTSASYHKANEKLYWWWCMYACFIHQLA